MRTVTSHWTREEAAAYRDSIGHQTNFASSSARIDQLAAGCHAESNAAGWWTNLQTGEKMERNAGELICLMHSELSEALEGARKDLPSDKIDGYSAVEEELADALIRIFDFAGALGLRLGDAFYAKTIYNRERADHKIEVRAAGGKQF